MLHARSEQVVSIRSKKELASFAGDFEPRRIQSLRGIYIGRARVQSLRGIYIGRA